MSTFFEGYPCDSLPNYSDVNPDKISVVTKIRDYREDRRDEYNNLNPIVIEGYPTIFIGRKLALDAILEFERMLSKMYSTPVATEFYSDPITLTTYVTYTLLNAPKDEETDDAENDSSDISGDLEPTEPEGE